MYICIYIYTYIHVYMGSWLVACAWSTFRPFDWGSGWDKSVWKAPQRRLGVIGQEGDAEGHIVKGICETTRARSGQRAWWVLAFTRYSFSSVPLCEKQYYYSQTSPLCGHPTRPLHRPHYCIIQCFPPALPYCNTCHTVLLVMAISCGGQSGLEDGRRQHGKRRRPWTSVQAPPQPHW